MPRRILFGEDVRNASKAAMHILHKAVSSSLGPSGKFSLLQREGLVDIITKDGVTIAYNCRPLEDEAQDLIAAKILEIAIKTNSQSGDGTTTSIVLANALFEESQKYIQKVDPVILRKEIEECVPLILEQLEEMATDVEEFEDIKNIATISANGDEQAGQIIAEAIDKVGTDGFVTLREGEKEEATLDFTEGYRFKKGPVTDRFLKGQYDKEFQNPYILLFDGKIEDPHTLDSIYMQIRPRPFVVIASLSEMCHKYMIENVMEGNMEGVVISPPGFKDSRIKYLQDIAAVTGANLLSTFTFEEGPNEEGKQSQITIEDLGQCDTIKFTKEMTDIIQGKGDKRVILERVTKIKDTMDKTKSQYEKDRLRERIGKLVGGAAIIGVGGTTEDEALERKDRFEDALNATRSAIEEGIIEGGGFALFKIAQKMRPKNNGQTVVKKALEAPLRTIIRNAGLEEDEIVEQVKNKKKGYDARKHEFVNLRDAGVIDPVKSTKSGLKNAVSIVDLLINLEVLSVNVLDKDNVREMANIMKNLKD